MYIAFYDALNAYAFLKPPTKEEKEIKFAYELHTFLRADDTLGRETSWKGAEMEELKGDLWHEN